MVEIEPSAQTLPPLNVGGQAHRRWRSLQELVVESLVVSLAMVVVDVLAHEETHVPFAEGDDATETLLLNRADEPLGIRVVKSRQLQLMPTLRIELFASRIPSIL